MLSKNTTSKLGITVNIVVREEQTDRQIFLNPAFVCLCATYFQVCVRVCGLFEVGLWLLVLLFFLCILAAAVWYVPFKFLPTWNCIIMRNQEVIEQPMTVETLPQRLLGEAQNFIKRWSKTNNHMALCRGFY